MYQIVCVKLLDPWKVDVHKKLQVSGKWYIDSDRGWLRWLQLIPAVAVDGKRESTAGAVLIMIDDQWS